MKTENKYFADNLKAVLSDIGCSQAELAKELKVNKNTINIWCQGESLPTLPQLRKLNSFFQTRSPKFNLYSLLYDNCELYTTNTIEQAVSLQMAQKDKQIEQLEKEVNKLHSRVSAYWHKYGEDGELYRLRNMRDTYKNYKSQFLKEKHEYIADEKKRVRKIFYDLIFNHIRVLAKDVLANGKVQKVFYEFASTNAQLKNVMDRFADVLGVEVAKAMQDSLYEFYKQKV